jgi:hypothetical protein
MIGNYIICILYKSALILAVPNRTLSVYEVQAIFPIAGAVLEEPDNGRGKIRILLLTRNRQCEKSYMC